jgi:hypothetical protein
MRTKTLLLTLAAVAAGITASQAQVYSVNAVGYVNLTVPPGYSLIANPLNGTNNLLSTILPAPPDGTFVLKWNPATQGFFDPNNYVDGLGWLPDNTVNPGEGIFVNIPPGPSATLTFVGEVPQGNLTNHISGNYTLLSSVVPQQLTLDSAAANLPVQDGDFVLKWDAANQRFFDPINYVEGLGWLPSAPTVGVGEGFFYNTTPAGARTWSRTFSVNN